MFDLDETLIHCNDYEPNAASDRHIKIVFPDGEIMDARINIRPYCRSVLRRLKKYFEIIVFTASDLHYARAILNQVDPEKELIDHILSR